MQRLQIDRRVPWGKHKGKTLLQIFGGIRPIPKVDLKTIWDVYGPNSVGNGRTEHYFHGLLSREDFNEHLPRGQQLLLHYQPDPSYIDWLIMNWDDSFIDPDDLQQLQSLAILTLDRIEASGTESEEVHLNPVFVTTTHLFDPNSFAICTSKRNNWMSK